MQLCAHSAAARGGCGGGHSPAQIANVLSVSLACFCIRFASFLREKLVARMQKKFQGIALGLVLDKTMRALFRLLDFLILKSVCDVEVFVQDHDSQVHGVESFAEAQPRIARYLETHGVLGVLLIDVSSLNKIERYYGIEAFETIRERLGNVVRDLSKDFLDASEIIITEGFGANEVVIFISRPRSDHRFYREELPSLVEAFHIHLIRQSTRIAYPYARNVSRLPTGFSVLLYNSGLGLTGQVMQSIALAREDAKLNAQIEIRRQRQQIVQMILAESLYSVYQPIYQLQSKKVFGYEALIRGGEQSALFDPDDIFKNAFDFDLTFELDCLCRRIALRGVVGKMLEGKLFLNCLPTAIKDPGFQGDALRRLLGAIPLRPSDVVLEISEQESISNFSLFREIRDRYSHLGFQIAVDDVGVGFSSLESIIELAPNYIKVDIALVRNIDTDRSRQEMLRTLNELAHKLGAEIIAEGIERPAELDTIKKIGIRYGQGFLLGRPAPLP